MKFFLAREEIVRQSGVDAESRYFHFESDTGLALNVLAKTVTVGVGPNLKTYSFKNIREWASRSERDGAVMPGASEAGLSVSVKDHDYPMWRIAMQDKAKREQWFEILAEVFVIENAGRARPRTAWQIS